MKLLNIFILKLVYFLFFFLQFVLEDILKRKKKEKTYQHQIIWLC